MSTGIGHGHRWGVLQRAVHSSGADREGAVHGVVRGTDKCQATDERLKAQGVTFLQEPIEGRPGVEAVLRDDSGNLFSLTQRYPAADKWRETGCGRRVRAVLAHAARRG
jgi:hypothetical protein